MTLHPAVRLLTHPTPGIMLAMGRSNNKRSDEDTYKALFGHTRAMKHFIRPDNRPRLKALHTEHAMLCLIHAQTAERKMFWTMMMDRLTAPCLCVEDLGMQEGEHHND